MNDEGTAKGMWTLGKSTCRVSVIAQRFEPSLKPNVSHFDKSSSGNDFQQYSAMPFVPVLFSSFSSIGLQICRIAPCRTPVEEYARCKKSVRLTGLLRTLFALSAGVQ